MRWCIDWFALAVVLMNVVAAVYSIYMSFRQSELGDANAAAWAGAFACLNAFIAGMWLLDVRKKR